MTGAPRSGLSLPSLRAAAGVFGASAAATAVWGIPAGFLWGALAPRLLVLVVSKGTAEIVQPETSAFIVADLWFCLIGVAGGLVTGVLGYLLAVRRRGPAAAAGLIVGALGAAAVTLWIGDNYGLAGFPAPAGAQPARDPAARIARARRHQRPRLLAAGRRLRHRRERARRPVPRLVPRPCPVPG